MFSILSPDIYAICFDLELRASGCLGSSYVMSSEVRGCPACSQTPKPGKSTTSFLWEIRMLSRTFLWLQAQAYSRHRLTDATKDDCQKRGSGLVHTRGTVQSGLLA